MKWILSYVKKYDRLIVWILLVKTSGSIAELLIPYVMEHLIDKVAPTKDLGQVALWGSIMLLLAVLVRLLNVMANRKTIVVAKDTAYRMRRDLFGRTLELSGGQVDAFGLPSLTSRMTADSYNVQNFVRAALAMGIRAPVLLFGGIAVTLTMDTGLAAILCVLAPVVLASVAFVTWKGIPLYEKVQQGLDDLVRVMRENITGIRVVKALSKEDYERERFRTGNEDLTRRERKAGVLMAMPGPIMSTFLNMGLTLVVLVGAYRVNDGLTEPGVILAFLTYFNMILMGAMGLNRIFIMMSKANASATRMAQVMAQPPEPVPIPEAQAATPQGEGFIRFEHVSFRYGENSERTQQMQFAGGQRENVLEDISFCVPKGGSLGILGATGSGKTSIINLLMRFYDPSQGHIFLDGRDLRTYDKGELRRKFGVVFQNDVVFADTIGENIAFGRDISPEQMAAAAADAQAAGFIEGYPDGYAHGAQIRGANFSGGQRQRILLSRAFAGNSEILVLDDASSALDYRTDAAVRRAVADNHSSATSIIIAQRVSSVMQLDDILVLDAGRIIGHGTHRELMENCPQYQQICRVQMGEEG